MDTSDMIREIENLINGIGADYNPGTGNINWYLLLSDVKRRMEEMQRILSKTLKYAKESESVSDEDLSKLIKDIRRLIK